MSIPDVIMSAEAADILGVQQRQLNRMVRRGEIPVVAKLDGATGPRLFDRAVIERLARERAA